MIVSSDLKWKEYVERMAGKANKTPGMPKKLLSVENPGYGKIYTFLK